MKVLALISGGLDSTIATKIVQNQGIDVEGVHFTTPFCQCDKCAVDIVGKGFNLKIHHIFLGEEFLDLLADPPHGYGSRMNICIDCRILMLKKAKQLAENIGAEYFVTGEVLGQRPFSQRFHMMQLIEKESGLEKRILRPLSAKLLPRTEPEIKGLIEREVLYSIQGRRRITQMSLADKLGLKDYPCPSGGCLLTDPNFASRLREYLAHEGKLSLDNIMLLRLGRHFRLDKTRIIVGRNKEENKALLSIAERKKIPHMNVIKYMGPVTLMTGEPDQETIKKAAAITVRYSDAPVNVPIEIKYVDEKTSTLIAEAIDDKKLERLRI